MDAGPSAARHPARQTDPHHHRRPRDDPVERRWLADGERSANPGEWTGLLVRGFTRRQLGGWSEDRFHVPLAGPMGRTGFWGGNPIILAFVVRQPYCV